MTDEYTVEMESGDNVGNWFLQAIDNIDARLGVGYAAAHPELISAMVTATAIDNAKAYIHDVLYKYVSGDFGDIEEEEVEE